MPNGHEYKLMESEADRILYTKVTRMEKDVGCIKNSVQWQLRLLVANLASLVGGLIYFIVGG